LQVASSAPAVWLSKERRQTAAFSVSDSKSWNSRPAANRGDLSTSCSFFSNYGSLITDSSTAQHVFLNPYACASAKRRRTLSKGGKAPQVAQDELAAPEGILTGYSVMFLGFDPSFKEQFAGPCSFKAFNLLLVFNAGCVPFSRS